MYLSSPTVGIDDRAPLGRALLRTLLMSLVLLVILLLDVLVAPGPRKGVAAVWSVGMAFVFGTLTTFVPWLVAYRANRATEEWTQAILAEVHADRDHDPVAQ
jgi:uncharacterized membrane protein